jgi:hypothetical protein
MSTINTVTAREPKLERDSVTFVIISRYFDRFSAAVRMSHAGRRCTSPRPGQGRRKMVNGSEISRRIIGQSKYFVKRQMIKMTKQVHSECSLFCSRVISV